MPLTARQARFVEEYLLDLNATQAAIRAGYSARTASANAYRLMAHDGVQQAIQDAQKARAARLQVAQDDVVAGLHAEAQDRSERSSHSARVAAWELLGRHLGMWPQKVEHGGGITLGIVTEIVDASPAARS
jgi:phage terminase small subunit